MAGQSIYVERNAKTEYSVVAIDREAKCKNPFKWEWIAKVLTLKVRLFINLKNNNYRCFKGYGATFLISVICIYCALSISKLVADCSMFNIYILK